MECHVGSINRLSMDILYSGFVRCSRAMGSSAGFFLGSVPQRLRPFLCAESSLVLAASVKQFPQSEELRY